MAECQKNRSHSAADAAADACVDSRGNKCGPTVTSLLRQLLVSDDSVNKYGGRCIFELNARLVSMVRFIIVFCNRDNSS